MVGTTKFDSWVMRMILLKRVSLRRLGQRLSPVLRCVNVPIDRGGSSTRVLTRCMLLRQWSESVRCPSVNCVAT